MDAAALCSTLRNTLQPTRQAAATATLRGYVSHVGFIPALLTVVKTNDIDLSTRHAAAIFLKNCVIEHWFRSSSLQIQETDRVYLRDSVFDALWQCQSEELQVGGHQDATIARLIATQLEICIEAMCLEDYPEQWPGLVPAVDAAISSANVARVMAAVRTLHQIINKYQGVALRRREQYVDPLVTALYPKLAPVLESCVVTQGPLPALLEKLILRLFYTSIKVSIPVPLMDSQVITLWSRGFICILSRPLSLSDGDEETRLRWKSRKWCLRIIHQLIARYGNTKHCRGEYKSFSKMFIKGPAGAMIDAILRMIESFREVVTAGEVMDCTIYGNVLQLSLLILQDSVNIKQLYVHIKPSIKWILCDVAFPLVCFNDGDAELWRDDPQETIRARLDMIGNIYSLKSTAIDIITTYLNHRNSDVFQSFFHLLSTVLAHSIATPGDITCQCRREGLYLIIGALGKIIQVGDETYSSVLYHLLCGSPLEDFDSRHGFIRARVCWLYGRFYNFGGFSTEQYAYILSSCMRCMTDVEMPVRVEAALALSCFLRDERSTPILRPMLASLLAEFLNLMKEIDNEDLVATVDLIIHKFEDSMAPYALGLLDHLISSFLQLRAEAAEDVAVSCFDDDSEYLQAAQESIGAINTLLGAVSAHSELFAAMEDALVPIVQQCMRPEDADYGDVLLETISILTYCSRTISPKLWLLFPVIPMAVLQWSWGGISSALTPIDNYISRGADTFCSNPDTIAVVVNFCRCILSNDIEYDGDDCLTAVRVIQSVLQNCRGRVDGYLPIFFEFIFVRIALFPIHSSSRVAMLALVADGLYYNPQLFVQTLNSKGWSGVFEQWAGVLHRTKGITNRKMAVFGLSSLLYVPEPLLPSGMRGAPPSFVIIEAIISMILSLSKTRSDQSLKNTCDEDNASDMIVATNADDADHNVNYIDDDATAEDVRRFHASHAGDGDDADADDVSSDNDGVEPRSEASDDDSFDIGDVENEYDFSVDDDDDDDYESPIDTMNEAAYFITALTHLCLTDGRRYSDVWNMLSTDHRIVIDICRSVSIDSPTISMHNFEAAISAPVLQTLMK